MTPEQIKSHAAPKRAFEVAQVGGLSVLLIGPRGSSKTTLREAYPDVLSDERDSCPCGNWHNPGRECRCSARLIYRWYRRIERAAREYDIVLETCPTPARDLLAKPYDTPEDTARWRVARVAAAQGFGVARTSLEMDDLGARVAEMALRRLSLTPGQWERILRVARAIANLDASELLKAKHIAEAVQYRADATIFRPERVGAV
jgi:magnesium chelatase family protein